MFWGFYCDLLPSFLAIAIARPNSPHWSEWPCCQTLQQIPYLIFFVKLCLRTAAIAVNFLNFQMIPGQCRGKFTHF